MPAHPVLRTAAAAFCIAALGGWVSERVAFLVSTGVPAKAEATKAG
jgi:hypothetical protein